MTDRKPPLGLIPRWLVDENRLLDIDAALQRYRDADMDPPGEWLDERRELVERLFQHRPGEATLAQPEPQGLTVEELMELVSRICGLPADCTYTMDGGRFSIEPGELVAFARAVARRSRPAFDPQVLTDEEIDEWQSHCAYLTRPRACGGAGTGDHYWAFDVDSDHVAGIVRAALTRWGRSAIEPQSENCPGCEGTPAANNSPCTVCGQLAQPGPQGPTKTQIMDLADDCGFDSQEISGFDGGNAFRDHGWECTDAQLLAFAAQLLARFGRPTIKPVPVAERLPGPEDCIRRGDDDWCWGQERSLLTGQAAARWRLMRVSALTEEAVTWLPHWALPVPTAP